MTITETRPSAATPAGPSPAPGAAPAGWFSTVDHKRLGLLLVGGGLAAIVAGCVLAAVYQAPGGANSPYLWTARQSRLSSATTSAALVVGLPAVWLGLFTYVVPLQIGATRLALPRLHALAVWAYGAGALVIAAGYAAGHPSSLNLASPLPPSGGRTHRGHDSTELVIAGLAIVAVAVALCAVSLLVTVISQRAPGMTFARLPALSWTATATCVVIVLAAPVFLSGLLVLYVNQRYGGAFFAAQNRGGTRVWQHQLWLPGRPEALVFTAASLGALCDVVGGRCRRPLAGFTVARAAAVAAVLLTLWAWAANMSVLRSPVIPTATGPTAALALPAGLVVLTWLGTLRLGHPGRHPSLPYVGAFLLVLLLAAAGPVVAAFAGVSGGDAPGLANAQITLLVLGAPLLAVAGALHHWAAKVWGRPSPPGLALLQLLLLLGGIVLLAMPGELVALGAGRRVAIIGVAGAALVALGVLLFAGLALGRRATGAGDDGGLTLEWATSSPPPVHNFDQVPEVHSAHPLLEPATVTATDEGPRA